VTPLCTNRLLSASLEILMTLATYLQAGVLKFQEQFKIYVKIPAYTNKSLKFDGYKFGGALDCLAKVCRLLRLTRVLCPTSSQEYDLLLAIKKFPNLCVANGTHSRDN
jgi:hypothetical protein